MTGDRHAFTIIEMLVVVTVLAVLLSLMMPAVMFARDRAQTMQCLAYKRQIGMADTTYRIDNKRWFVGNNNFVVALAVYTQTPEKYYKWAGYGTNWRNYVKAHPFKCPMVQMNTIYEGGYNQAVMNMSAGGVSDLALNSALHGSFNAGNEYQRRRKDTMLVHSPVDVLNYTDALSGHDQLDYSNFGAGFKHNNGLTLTMLYADGHAVAFTDNYSIALNRGANNTNPMTEPRPYFWW
jgi:prepilin-type N-terminal cleavage/methylation domain-containing protein/prepilin-type processing-associated H-X9-DG protein